MTKKIVILDTDPGIDDAVALAYLANSDLLDLRLITTVAGNVGIEAVTHNALKLLAFYGKKIPLAKGAAKPLLRESQDASDVHGETGLAGFEGTEEADCLLEVGAVEAMYQTIKASERPVTLVAVGPLTNIANLILSHPDCLDGIEELIFMGGAIGRGNYGVYTEFNMGFDPEAAKVVFESPLKKTMVGLEIGNKAVIRAQTKAKIDGLNKYGTLFNQLFAAYRADWVAQDTEMYDVTAAAYVLRSDLFTTQDLFVVVETAGTWTAGATLCDIDGILKQKANVTVCTDIDAKAFEDWFVTDLEKMQ